MGRTVRLVAALAVALLAWHATSVSARTRVMMCSGCGVVIDADPIYYARDEAPQGAVAGSIIGAKDDGSTVVDRLVARELIGRDARRSERGDDPRGLRLEIRMDGGGERTIEVAEGTRVYRRDRVRVHDDRIEVLD